jgi:hypothetical protein
VTTLLDEASLAGLTYLGDALPSEVTLELASDAVRARASDLDLAGALQLADFTRETAFRRALLVRTDRAEAKHFRAPAQLDAVALTDLRVASRLLAVGDRGTSEMASFEGPGTTVQVSGVARRALEALADAAPRSVACIDLAREIRASVEVVTRELYDLWLVTPGLDLHTCEPAFTTKPSTRPRASAVARWHAIEGGPVTNVWHQQVDLPEPIARDILGRLDGTATVGDLTRAVSERGGGRVTSDEARAVVGASLAMLARAALLVE